MSPAVIVKKLFLTVFASLVCILIQGTILRTFFPSSYLPNLLIGVLVYISFVEISVLGVFLAFLVGLILDVFSSHLLGAWAGAFVVVFFIFSLFAQRVYVGSAVILMAAGAFASAIASAMYIFITAPYSEEVFQSFAVVGYEALFSAFTTPLLFAVMKRLHKRVAGRSKSYSESY